MVPYFIFTFGLFLRAVYVSVTAFKKSDIFIIGGALLVGLFAVARLVEESQSESVANPGLGLVFGFSLIVAFAFKERICPIAGEGLMLLYGFIGAYIFVVDFLMKGAEGLFVTWGIFFLLIYTILAITTAVTSGNLSKGFQVVHMVMYLIMSIGIGVWLTIQGLNEVNTSWGLVLLGYSSLTLISNIHYVLYLIPISGRRQSFSERMKDIGEHALFLESKFISVDLPVSRLLLIIAVCVGLIVFDVYTQISTPVLIAFVLSAGAVLFHPNTPWRQPGDEVSSGIISSVSVIPYKDVKTT